MSFMPRMWSFSRTGLFTMSLTNIEIIVAPVAKSTVSGVRRVSISVVV